MRLDLTRTKNMQGLDVSSCVNMTFAKYAQGIEAPCKVLGKNFNAGGMVQGTDYSGRGGGDCGPEVDWMEEERNKQ